MANVFDISNLAGTIAGAKDKALAMAGEYGLNEALGGHVLPPLPPFAGGGQVRVSPGGNFNKAEEVAFGTAAQLNMFGQPMCFPLRIRPWSAPESTIWTLPMEPMITLNGGNTIVRRNVAKADMRGTIKERWNQDDYEISIEGVFTKKDEWTYPEADIKKLWQMLESKDTFYVECELLAIFHISRIVVDKFDFPFTKGEENQGYRIHAYSDDNWDLLIKNDSDVL